MNFNRRDFLLAGGTMVAALGTKGLAVAADAPKCASAEAFKVGAPCLQAPAETTMGISWKVTGLSSGAVEFADNPALAGARTARCLSVCGGLVSLDDSALQVRLEGLKPATTYYYRTVTTHFLRYDNAYSAQLGETLRSEIHSFTTLGKGAKAHFCVMSDTHANWRQFERTLRKIAAIKPKLLIWNGDATNTTQRKSEAVEIFLDSPVAGNDFSADLPTAYLTGNHDLRGSWACRREEVVLPRHPAERNSVFWSLKWNFAQRLGDVALIGMDTGEDKPDAHPKWFGLANYTPYRKAQAKWLAEQLKRHDIASAKFKVVVCHIPLFAPPNHPDFPKDGVKIDPNDYAYWSRECNELWGPLLAKYKVNLVIAGHRHRFRYDPPSADRPWAQVLCGGHEVKGDEKFPSVLEAFTENGRLHVRVHDLHRDVVAFDEVLG